MVEGQKMDNIRKSLKAKSNMSEASIREIFRNSLSLEFPKRHILTSSFQLDKYFYFIEKGIARSFCVINGKEVTSWFSMEGDIIFSTNSFYGKMRGYEYEMVQLLENRFLFGHITGNALSS